VVAYATDLVRIEIKGPDKYSPLRSLAVIGMHRRIGTDRRLAAGQEHHALRQVAVLNACELQHLGGAGRFGVRLNTAARAPGRHCNG